MVADTTVRAKQVVQGEGLYSWLLQYARERVPVSELQGDLPDPL